MMQTLGIDAAFLIIWDADFSMDRTCPQARHHVLCEINVSSVFCFLRGAGRHCSPGMLSTAEIY
jgi:hypothetical protein